MFPDAVAVSGNVTLAVFATIGLLGGVHCLGMCGPLVTVYAKRMDDGGPLSWREIRQHALFNLGRTASYAAVGALAGAVGAVVFDAAAVVRVGNTVQAVTGVAVGAFIVATGASYVLGGSAAFDAGSVLSTGGLFGRVVGTIRARVDALAGGPGIVALGALHGLLPCPILYPAFLYAFGRGSPVEGGLSLAALGLGTVPALFLYGTVLGSANPASRARLHRALGVAFLALGYLPLSHGLMLFGVHLPHVPIPFHQPLG